MIEIYKMLLPYFLIVAGIYLLRDIKLPKKLQIKNKWGRLEPKLIFLPMIDEVEEIINEIENEIKLDVDTREEVEEIEETEIIHVRKKSKNEFEWDGDIIVKQSRIKKEERKKIETLKPRIKGNSNL